MARNLEHETVYKAAWDALADAAHELLPPDPIGVESPMERAQRAFMIHDFADTLARSALGYMSGALSDLAEEATKPRRAGLQWAASVLMGTNV